jgi:hypothetical protein
MFSSQSFIRLFAIGWVHWDILNACPAREVHALYLGGFEDLARMDRPRFDNLIGIKFYLDNSGRLRGERSPITCGKFGPGVRRFGFGHCWLPYFTRRRREITWPEDCDLDDNDIAIIAGLGCGRQNCSTSCMTCRVSESSGSNMTMIRHLIAGRKIPEDWGSSPSLPTQIS